jgi:hypothetical protein
MKKLTHPLPQKRRDQIPIIAYINEAKLFELPTYQEAIKLLKQSLSCSGRVIEKAVWEGAFNFATWPHNGNEYDFRTSKERKELGVIRRKTELL